MCFVWIWEQTAIISLYSINWLVFITETECVYCAVRTGSLYKILRSAHTVYLCVLCGSENKQRLFPYTAFTNWFLQQRRSVFTARYGLYFKRYLREANPCFSRTYVRWTIFVAQHHVLILRTRLQNISNSLYCPKHRGSERCKQEYLCAANKIWRCFWCHDDLAS